MSEANHPILNSTGAGPAQSIELGALWRLLLAGRLVITSAFGLDGRSLLELEHRPYACPIPQENSRIVERVLEGECPKALAAELGLTVSALSGRCANVLLAMGINGCVSRAPAILVMAVFAARCVAAGQAQMVRLADGLDRWLIEAPNPVTCLRERLSPSEYEVASLAIDGKTHSEIALARRTSQRTVANQLASIFQKCGVSGRADLRAKAIFECARRLRAPPAFA